jgi:uncharacterized protein (TIGR02266 family)
MAADEAGLRADRRLGYDGETSGRRSMATKRAQDGTPQLDADSGADRRKWQRILVDLEVDYGDQDNFLFAYITDISATGIFVRTDTPEPPGTHLNLRFTPGGASPPLELEGEVIWIHPYRPGHAESLNPGMGIRFVDLGDDDRGHLANFIKTFALLDSAD